MSLEACFEVSKAQCWFTHSVDVCPTLLMFAAKAGKLSVPAAVPNA